MNYVNELDSPQEALSALADGELSPAQAQALVQASRDDAALMQSWASYHAIGQALRAHASDAKVHRVHQPVVVAAAPAPASVLPLHLPQQAAANESVFRWKLLAGVAALAAVGTMLWALVGLQGNVSGVQLAQPATAAPAVAVTNAPAVAVTNAPAVAVMQAPAVVATSANGQAAPSEATAVMIRDPQLDELLAAHKQFGGASALQQPAGFLRNATFQTMGR